MKICRLIFVCILTALFVAEILPMNAMAEESSDSNILNIGYKIEQYVDEHSDTTGRYSDGMGVCIQIIGMDQRNAAFGAGKNRSGS